MNQFGTGAGYALGAVVSSTSDNAKNGSDGDAPDTSTTNGFTWFDGALQSSITHNPNVSNSLTYNTGFTYDGFGSLTGMTINDGRPRIVTITNDMNGQALRRDEQETSDTYNQRGDPHEIWYRYAGKQMGYSGNNGTLDTSYDTSIANRQKLSNNNGTGTTGNFRWGGTQGSSVGDFDQGVEKINSYSQGGGGGTHTVRGGDTLHSIAAAIWGDSTLRPLRGAVR